MTSDTGAKAEDQALAYLRAQGLSLVERNYRCRQGEIDLIMQQGDTLVFIEVRYRRQSHFGSALESVDARKQARLVHSARHFLHCHSRLGDPPCRFDVIGISGDQGTINWLKNAFGA